LGQIFGQDVRQGDAMPASDYVNAYLQLWCWVNDTFTVARVRNYLQSGKGPQATRAASE
jgi:hypothetical protein